MQKTIKNIIQDLLDYYGGSLYYKIDADIGLTKLLYGFYEAYEYSVKDTRLTTGKESYIARWVKPILYVPKYDSVNVIIEPETSFILHELVHVFNSYKKRHQGIFGLRTDELQAETITFMVDICYSITLLSEAIKKGSSGDKITKQWAAIAARIDSLVGMKVQGVCRKWVTQKDLDIIYKEFGFKLNKNKLFDLLQIAKYS